MSVKAFSLRRQAFQAIPWCAGNNKPLSERFAALRVCHAGGKPWARHVYARSTGCSLTGPPGNPSRASRSCQPCPRALAATTWSEPPTSDGALRVTAKASSRTWAGALSALVPAKNDAV